MSALLQELKRRKALFDAALSSSYGAENIPLDSDAAGPFGLEGEPDDGEFIVYVLEHWPAIIAALEKSARVQRAVGEVKVQRDPRHRVSMLVNDWQDILGACVDES